MNNWFLIPLAGVAETFAIALNGQNYQMTVYWNNTPDLGGWNLDMANADTGASILAGCPLVCGTDLLAGLEYLGIGGSLYVYTQGQPFTVPTFTDLGVNCNLYFAVAA